jgi:hypothetical protein
VYTGTIHVIYYIIIYMYCVVTHSCYLYTAVHVYLLPRTLHITPTIHSTCPKLPSTPDSLSQLEQQSHGRFSHSNTKDAPIELESNVVVVPPIQQTPIVLSCLMHLTLLFLLRWKMLPLRR